MKQKTCKVCKIKFIPTQFAQVACNYKCAIIHAKDLKKKKSVSVWKKEKSALKESLLTKKDYLNILQKVFNTYIRQRDKGRPCVSCDKPYKEFDINASHYFSVGSSPSLRFNEDNVHASCIKCNKELHGNIAEYTIRLPKKIGVERFEKLKQDRNATLKLSIEDVKDLIKKYRELTKKLK